MWLGLWVPASLGLRPSALWDRLEAVRGAHGLSDEQLQEEQTGVAGLMGRSTGFSLGSGPGFQPGPREGQQLGRELAARCRPGGARGCGRAGAAPFTLPFSRGQLFPEHMQGLPRSCRTLSRGVKWGATERGGLHITCQLQQIGARSPCPSSRGPEAPLRWPGGEFLGLLFAKSPREVTLRPIPA